MRLAIALATAGLLAIGGAAAADHHRGGRWAWNPCQQRMVYYSAPQAVNHVSVLAEEKKKDVVDTAVAADDFNTLVAAVKAAGLVETLKGKGPFTVFAPTDAAFKELPPETLKSLLKPENKRKLTSILTYHVVAGKVTADQVVKLDSAKTVNGKSVKIEVKDGKVYVDGATVVKTDIACSNGVIHVIDKVILPK